MSYKILTTTDKDEFDKLTNHPLQSWEWGNFREKIGTDVVRIGIFNNNKLDSAFQLTFHKIPFLPYTISYFPKGKMWNSEMIKILTEIGKKKNAIFIKLEPNVVHSSQFTVDRNEKIIPSLKPLFTKYTFYIDLTKNEDELFKNLHSKTRYNIKLAQKHNVIVQEENTQEAFAKYLELTKETCKRQGFYAHTDSYHKMMWSVLRPANIAHLFTARYQGKILVTWILFLYKNVLYYPYGASSIENKEVMASNLMMWETIIWGKKMGAKIFDLWGTPGPDPKPTDSYYGFHKFKLGYNPRLIEFIGSYDLILKQPLYTLFNLVDKFRWIFLKIKSKITNF